MAQMRAILSRKKAAQKIQKITRAMAMIAGARLQKLRPKTLAAKAYAQKLREMAMELAENAGESPNPLLRQRSAENSAGRTAVLVVTSNRGLAGAYNTNLLRIASDFIREREAKDEVVELYVIGKKAVSYFSYHKRSIAGLFNQFGDTPSYADVEKVAMFFTERFIAGCIDSVHLVHTEFISAGTLRPTLLTLLPAAALLGVSNERETSMSPAMPSDAVTYDFSPNPVILLGELLPPMVAACLFECLLSAATSENASRKMAMMRATQNADQMSKNLTLRYNRARQEHITSELLDIIGATEAIRKQ